MLPKHILDYQLTINQLSVWTKQMYAAQQSGRGQMARQIAVHINIVLESISDLNKAWYRSMIKLD